MNNIRRTKPGIAICPFFTWTSEDIERTGHNENDVNLTHCTHKANKHDHEGNCCEPDCPLLESEPEPTEDQKKVEAMRENWKDVDNARADDVMTLIGIIDHQANHIKLLKQCDDSSTEVIGKLDAENKNLKDEILKAYGRMDSIEQALKDGRG